LRNIITIVYAGDSIIFGQTVAVQERWTNLIIEYCNKLYYNTPLHIYSVNYGISGATTRDALLNWSEYVQKESPTILFIQYGLNDCNCWLTDRGLPRVSPMCFRHDLYEMIARAKHFGTEKIILINNHKTLREKVMLNGEKYDEANAKYSKIINEVALEAGVILFDIRDIFERFFVKELEKLVQPYPDQIHLTAEGHKVYAKNIKPIIKTIITELIK
jgi:lysophospholipase L1-like esterase